MPDILFVPLSAGGGTGELVSSLQAAHAVHEGAPGARIRFMTPPDAEGFEIPYPRTTLSPIAGRYDDLSAVIAGTPPDVLVMNGGCRTTTLEACRRRGIRSVVMSTTPAVRDKALRLPMLLRLDEHWMLRGLVTRPPLPARARWLRPLLARGAFLSFDYILSRAPGMDALSPDLRDHASKPFVLFTPGGGGYAIAERPVAEVFHAVAKAVSQRLSLRAIVVAGPAYAGVLADTDFVRCTRSLPPEALAALSGCAEAVVINGGTGLHTALATGAACIAAPIGGADQPARIREYATAGLVQASKPDEAALTDAVTSVLNNAGLLASMKARARGLALVNGAPGFRGAAAGWRRVRREP